MLTHGGDVCVFTGAREDLARSSRVLLADRADGICALSPTLNVLALVQLPTLQPGVSGVGRSVRELTEHLAVREDVRLQLLVDRKEREAIVPRLGEPWTHFTYRSFVLDSARQQARWLLLDRPRAEVFWPEAQIVFCTTESYVPTRTARLVVSVHGASLPGAPQQDGAGRPLGRIGWKMLAARLERNADAVHTTLHATADRLTGLAPNLRDRIRVVPEGVSAHFFEPVPFPEDRLMEAYGLGLDKPFVLLLGRPMRDDSDAAAWTTAFRVLGQEVPGLTVVALDLSAGTEIGRLQALAREFRIDLRLLSSSAQEHKRASEKRDVQVLASAAAAAWSPGEQDEFRRLRLVEAMAAGTPVVAGDQAANRESTGGAALLACATDGATQAEAMLSLLRSSHERQRRILEGREFARTLSWAASAAAMKRVFDAVL